MLILIKNPFFYNLSLLILIPAAALVYFVVFLFFKKYIFGHLKYASI